jgi:hypothetical protein
VEDLRTVQKDEGFCTILRRVEQRGMRRSERREVERMEGREKPAWVAESLALVFMRS